MSRSFDVVVIGAGPGGYVAAIRAAQKGLSVACIDEWKNREGKNAFGGTCLNAGCIPSKALLESSELYHRAQHEFKKHGISTGEVSIDVGKMQKRRATIVRQLTGGIGGLFRAAKVEGLVGHGKLLSGKKVEFTPVDGEPEVIDAKHVILASGSAPIELPFAKFDGETIIDSWDALELEAAIDEARACGGMVRSNAEWLQTDHGKVLAAEKLARQYGIDLGESFFYSDSTDDLELLERVGNTRPLNPSSKLLSIAEERGWPVRRFASRGRAKPTDFLRTAMVPASLPFAMSTRPSVSDQVFAT